ncbi:MAG: hypothetical protein D6785_06400 [Planctomycetota bacterium]|nr:MAG: hypothetical protein D6785_06400 [Planctomycetota bacterium]
MNQDTPKDLIKIKIACRALLPYQEPYLLPIWLRIPRNSLKGGKTEKKPNLRESKNDFPKKEISSSLNSKENEREKVDGQDNYPAGLMEEESSGTGFHHSLIDERSRIQWKGNLGATSFPFISKKRYELIQLIGQGGMGSVYKALDKQTQRIVALKRILVTHKNGQTQLERFYREAQTIARLNHPYIVPLFDIGRDEKGPFLTMQFIEGVNLKEKIRHQGPFALEEAIRLMIKIGQALFYAHRYGVIHRDIKPENIMIGSGGLPRILDFGLARIGQKSDLSLTGAFIGTQFYASPEQLENPAIVDHRTDIYSLGATFYFILTGETPRVLRPDRVPEKISSILFRCLEEKVENRYFSVDRIIEDLEKLVEPQKSKKSENIPLEKEEKKPSPKIIKGLCQCGHVNDKSVLYCENCGEALFRDCPNCNRKVSVNVKNCGFCGVNISLRLKTLALFEEAKKYNMVHELSKAKEKAKEALQIESLPTIKQFLRHVEYQEKNFLDHMQNGDKAFEEGNYILALYEYKKALKLIPNHKEAQTKVENTEVKLYKHYIIEAVDALEEENLERSKRACLEALKIIPSKEVKEILAIVEEQIRKKEEKELEEAISKRNFIEPDEDEEDDDEVDEIRIELEEELMELAKEYEANKKRKSLRRKRQDRMHQILEKMVQSFFFLVTLAGIGFMIGAVIVLVMLFFKQ